MTNGQSVILSGVLTTSEPSAGTDVAGRTRDVHSGIGRSNAELLPRTTNCQRGSELHHHRVNQTTGTARNLGQLGGNTDYQSSSAASKHRPHPDHADRERRHQRLRGRRIRLGRAHQLHHRRGHSRRKAGDADLRERHASRALATTTAAARHVLHHTERGGRDLLAGCFVRRRHGESAAIVADLGKNSFVVTLEETAIAYTRSLHRCKRDAVHHVGQPDHGWRTTGRPGGPHDPRVGQHGPELHRDHQLGRYRELHHCLAEPDRRNGPDRRLLRRRRLLPARQRIRNRDNRSAPFWGSGAFVIGDVSAGKPTVTAARSTSGDRRSGRRTSSAASTMRRRP